MRIGIMGGAPGLKIAADHTPDGLVAWGQELEAAGFDTLWLAHTAELDAITALSWVGRETERLELGTAVVPTYSRHPIAMAQQALTASAASGGRFRLGLGLSHRFIIEGSYGLSFEKPIRHLREYLEVLTPLLAGEPVDYRGETYRVKTQLQIEAKKPVPVLVAALGPQMLGLTGRMADGTITWMTGEKTLEGHIIPRLRAAASAVGRPDPRVIAGLPVILTNRPEEGRERVNERAGGYGRVPSYKAMLEREGAAPGDIALVGDEAALRARVKRLEEIGVDDLDAVVVSDEGDTAERTLEFLSSLL